MKAMVLLLEDHPIFRDALTNLLRKSDESLFILAAGSVEEGVLKASQNQDPAAILLDFHLPGLQGVEAILALRDKFPTAPVIMVSGSESRQDVMAAIKAGAAAFVSKTVPPEELCDLVHRVLSGRLDAPEWLTASGRTDLYATPLLDLTDRQQECLSLLSQGLSNKEIGLHLGIAEITVKNHLSALFRALNAVNRTQAVMAARRLGLIAVRDGH